MLTRYSRRHRRGGMQQILVRELGPTERPRMVARQVRDVLAHLGGAERAGISALIAGWASGNWSAAAGSGAPCRSPTAAMRRTRSSTSGRGSLIVVRSARHGPVARMPEL